ncbi:WD domain protein, partial [Mortierella sp. GBA35]
MLLYISGDAEQIIQRYAAKLLADLLTVAEEIIPKPYPLMDPLPLPTTSPLLVKAPKVPVVEQDIRLFLARRLDQHERHNQVVYIPPQAKASLEAKDDDSFPLMEKVKEFLENNQQVFLVLGDSGVGKSTFIRHLEQELMGDYKPGGRIPLFINLPAIDKPEKELISEQLKTLDFTDDNIQEMKRDRQFILICDGYDESQLAINLHSTNSFNQPDQWDVKMVISCRSTYLSQNYRDRFQPQPIDRYRPPTPHLFQEAVIVPFSNAQIKDYVEQFVRDKEVHKLFNGRPIWSSEEYVDKLMRVPKLMSLVTNPFLLILSLRTLPIMVYGVRDLTEIEVSRARMYEVFVQQWLEINVRRLRFSKLKEEATTILEELIEAGLTQIATGFLKDLAAAIYQEQDGNQLVRYIHRDDKETWKARFFGPAIDAVLLRDASPLSRAGTLYRFIHRTLLEHFYGFEEGEIHQFKSMRLREYEALRQKSYIPPMAKASPQASDDESFPLMDKIKEFLHSDEQVFLVLGDYRAGKTTFSRHLENELLATYKQDGPIPLFINLPTFEEQETDLISKQLGRHNFSNDVIQEFKKHRRFIVICDGYDTNRFSMNLHTTNSFNRPGQWRVKMIVSCRSMRHDIDYRRLFEPQSSDRRGNTTTSLFQMAVMIPFSTDQVRNYVKQFVRDTEVHELYGRGSAWDMEELMNKILKVSNIEELVSVPSLLTQALTALSKRAQSEQDFSDVRLTRVEIYDLLAEQWLQTNKGRLDDRPIPTGAGLPCNELVDSDFLREGIKYQKDLAAAIFEHQGGEPIIEHSNLRDTKSWKARFFGPDVKTTILRESRFVTRSGNRYRFLQRSLLDYFYCRVIFDPFEQGRCSVDDGSRETGAPLQTVNHPLNQRSIVKDPGTLLFLAERVGQCPLFKKQLFATIEESKIDSKVSQAAANAITILVRAGERFTGMDLSGTRIAGADLSGGDFDSVQLAGADLMGVTLTKAWLRHANFRGAQMRDVQFGVWPYLELRAEVNTCAYSSDGKFFVIGFGGGAISLYRTETWEKVRDFGGHDWTVTALAFSPENDQLASSSEDKLVKVWNIKTGALEHTIGGQSETVASVVYSPKGHLIAAASYDNFVRLYDIPDRDPDQSNIDVCSVAFILKGHTGAVKSVTFSPSGLLIATASYDLTVRLWEPETGVQKHVLRGHTAWVTTVSISPTNNMVASSGQDMTIRLWNTVTGTALYILRGHIAFVKAVSFSPSGHQLASCSGDHTVRLWDGLTGTPGRILSGHTQAILTLAYSPDKQQIATGSWDSTSHSTSSVEGVAISPGNSRAGSMRGHLHRTDSLSYSIDIVRPTFATAVDINSNDHTISFSVVACSSDGQVVATCSRDVARLHDAYTGTSKMELHGHTDSVTSLAFSPDNQLLVTGSYDRTVRIWKIQNGECEMVLEGHTEAVTA